MAETIRVTENVINKVEYPPELIPFSAVFSVPAGGTVSPKILNFRKLNVRKVVEKILILSYISQPRNANVLLEYEVDDETMTIATSALKNYPDIEELYVPAIDKLVLNYRNIGIADVTNYYSLMGLWVLKPPTTAEKMFYKYYNIISQYADEDTKLNMMEMIPVDERRLTKKYGLLKLLEKGTYPLKLPSNPLTYPGFKLEREYQVIRDEVRTIVVDIEANQENLLFDIKPNEKKGEFIVLTGISAQPPADPTYGTQIAVERDETGEYFRLDCYPMSLDWYVPMWIPAISRLKLSVYTDTAISSWACRVRYKVCRLNNILKARWFYDDFVAKHPELEEFAERVRLGIW